MSQLISSGVSGKKVAPKVPARRRAPPAAPLKPPVAKQPTPIAISDSENEPITTTTVPPTPPPTQPTPILQRHASRAVSPLAARRSTPPPPAPREPTPPPPRQPSPALAVQPTTEAASTSTSAQAQQRLAPVASVEPDQSVARADPPGALPPFAPNESLLTTVNDPTARQHVPASHEQPAAPPEKQTRKRKTTAAASKPAPKRQKKSSTRSNETVQAEVNAGSPAATIHTTAQDATTVASPPAIDAPPPIQQTAPEAVMTRTRTGRGKKTTTAKRTPKKKTTPKSAAVVVEEKEDEQPQAQEEQAEDEELPDVAAVVTKAPKTKKPRKKKAVLAPAIAQPPPAEDQGEVVDGEEQEAEGDDEDEGSDLELHEIDPNTVQMYDITKRTYKYGKTSDRERKMGEIDWDEVKRKRLDEVLRIESGQQARKEKEKQKGKEKDKNKDKHKEGEPGDGVVESTEGGADVPEQEDGEELRTSPSPPSEPDEDQEEEPPAQGLQLRIVNGQIVEDETSLQINRPTTTAPDALSGAIEEENDLTQRLNRFTYLNDRRRAPTERVPQWRQKSDPWNAESTERFYEELARWGTDFQLLAALFPGKTRHQVKTKFNREEKLDPKRIGDALLGRFVKGHVVPVLPTPTPVPVAPTASPAPAAASPLATSAPATAPNPVPATIRPLRPQMNLAHYALATGRDLEEFTRYEGYEHAQREMREDFKEREVAMQAAMEEEREMERQARLAAELKEKGRKEIEGERRKGRGRGRGRGRQGGMGTLGGGE